jgi:adenylate cyclase
VVTIEQRRADYTQLMQQVPAINQLFQIDSDGREALRLTRSTVSIGSGEDFSRDPLFTQAGTRGVSFGKAYFRDSRPLMSIAVKHSGPDAAVTVAEIDLRFLSGFVGEAQVGKIGSAYLVDPKGVVLASSSRADSPGKNLSTLPQIATLLRTGNETAASGRDDDGNAVLAAAEPVPRLGWFAVFAPQGTPADIIKKLNAGLNEVLKQPDIAGRLKQLNIDSRANTPDEFRTFVADETEKWGKVVRDAGIKLGS